MPSTLNPPFHARHSATDRTYVYQVWNAPHPFTSVFMRSRYWHIDDVELDRDAMEAALALIVGRRDFGVFQSAGCQATSSVRDMTQARMTVEAASMEHQIYTEAHDAYRMAHKPQHTRRPKSSGAFTSPPSSSQSPLSFTPRLLSFHFTSRSFLYHQIRNLMGIIIQVGRGTISIEQVKELLLIPAESTPTPHDAGDVPPASLAPLVAAPPNAESPAASSDCRWLPKGTHRQRQMVGRYSAPPDGLYLRRVEYDVDIRDWSKIEPAAADRDTTKGTEST